VNSFVAKTLSIVIPPSTFSDRGPAGWGAWGTFPPMRPRIPNKIGGLRQLIVSINGEGDIEAIKKLSIEKGRNNFSGPLSVTRSGVMFDDDIYHYIYMPKCIDNHKLDIGDDGHVSWHRLDGSMADTGKLDFIINEDNTIYAYDLEDEALVCKNFREKQKASNAGQARILAFSHVSLMGDKWPIFAGSMTVENGRVKYLSNGSGHFKPPSSDVGYKVLRRQGVSLSSATVQDVDSRFRTEQPSNKDRVVEISPAHYKNFMDLGPKKDIIEILPKREKK
jgi:hypothetical protein